MLGASDRWHQWVSNGRPAISIQPIVPLYDRPTAFLTVLRQPPGVSPATIIIFHAMTHSPLGYDP